MLKLYIASIGVELLMFVPIAWRLRKYIVPVILITIGFSVGYLITKDFSITICGLVILAAFRIFNLLRINESRLKPEYLYHSTRRTAAWLIFYHLVLLTLSQINHTQLTFLYMWALLTGSICVLLVTLQNIKKTRHVSVIENYADRDLPTVTVAIPARNETQDLEDCIRSVLANNYPKLEVIVLDDCSRDKTPEIIKNFAQDGVRFLPGRDPDEHWLAKNLAYERLAEEANGELILFCGVDVRFGPEAIRALVSTLLSRKKNMISILPRRISGIAKEAFIQPMRYWWELALPRRPFNRPPVLSTCWLIKKKTLNKLGGFAAISHTIIPEGYFARELVKKDGYSFIRADDLLDIQTRKSVADQRETALRHRYPELRKRPEWALFLSVIEVLGLLMPFGIALSSLWLGLDGYRLIALLCCVMLIVAHIAIVEVSNPANVLVAAVNFPLVVITELILGYASMYQYEFSTIEWKGRNICIPVMQTIPHLPKV